MSTDYLRAIDESDLDRLLSWRNSEQVRRFMYSSQLIKREEHLRWFEAIRHDQKRYPLIFVRDETPCGYVNIGPIKPGGIAAWGFYAAPDAPPGTGHRMGQCALKYAFETLHLHKLCGEALGYNEASQRFHRRLGFIQEGDLVDQHFDGSAYHNVICFGLTVDQWRQQRMGNGDDSNG